MFKYPLHKYLQINLYEYNIGYLPVKVSSELAQPFRKLAGTNRQTSRQRVYALSKTSEYIYLID